MAERKLIIAIDGPAGAGKSTVARTLAERLGYLFINTGAMYRAVAWLALGQEIALSDAEEVGKLASEAQIEISGQGDAMRVMVDGLDITNEISAPQISHAASVVSAIPAVRRVLVAKQQQMASGGGVVMEGRDIGTQVFPNADVKIYLDASSIARTTRRFTEDQVRGLSALSFDQMKSEIEERDHRDRTREDSPLTQAAGAIHIDSSDLSAEQVVQKILNFISDKLMSKS